MKCRKVRNRLADYSTGDLSPELEKEIRAHLPGCPDCSGLLSELEVTLGLLDRRVRLEPNPFLYTRIRERTEGEKAETTLAAPFFRRVLQPVMISILIGGALFSGIKIGNSLSDDPQNLYYGEETEYYLNDMQHESVEVLLLQDPVNQKD
jgi:hypothetical protein